MLESTNFAAEFFRDAEKHKDFVLTVAMGVDVAPAFENFDQRIKAKIAARRDQIFFTRGNAFFIIIPGFLVIARFHESTADGLFDAHARGGIPFGLPRNAEVGAFGVFAESELDARERAFEGEPRRGLAPAEFDDDRLATDGIGRAVKNIGGRDAPGKVAIDVYVIGIEDLGYIRH